MYVVTNIGTGEILTQKFYDHGKLEGDYLETSYSGIIKTTYKNNEIHGSYRMTSPTGAILIEAVYLDGEIVGEFKDYFASG